MKRVVLDTNVLVGSAYDEHSASWRIIDACIRGELTAIVSPALQGEYEEILARTVRMRGHEERVQKFLAAAEYVRPAIVPRVVQDDPDDDKVLATAVAGKADTIVTNDRHLLQLDPYLPEGSTSHIRIVQPTAFEQSRTEEHGSGWGDLARLIGIR